MRNLKLKVATTKTTNFCYFFKFYIGPSVEPEFPWFSWGPQYSRLTEMHYTYLWQPSNRIKRLNSLANSIRSWLWWAFLRLFRCDSITFFFSAGIFSPNSFNCFSVWNIKESTSFNLSTRSLAALSASALAAASFSSFQSHHGQSCWSFYSDVLRFCPCLYPAH